MPVDKFGRGDYGQTQGIVVNETSSSSAVSLTQMNDILRRDGTNTAIGTINMTRNTLTNVSDPVAGHDAANKFTSIRTLESQRVAIQMMGDLNMNNFRLTG